MGNFVGRVVSVCLVVCSGGAFAMTDLGVGKVPIRRVTQQVGPSFVIPPEGLPIVSNFQGLLARFELDDLERASRRFLESQQKALPIGTTDLAFDRSASFIYGTQREMWVATYKQVLQPENIEVLGTRISMRIKYGKLLQMDYEAFPKISISLVPTLSFEEAQAKAMTALSSDPENVRVAGEKKLFVYPAQDTFHLVYRYVATLANQFGSQIVLVDAQSGEIVERYSTLHFMQGKVVGLIKPRLAIDSVEEFGLPYLDLRAGGQTIGRTKKDGSFATSLTGGSVSFQLKGPGFMTGQCNAVSMDMLSVLLPDLVSGTKCDTQFGRFVFPMSDGMTALLSDDSSSTAERGVYFHLNKVRDYAAAQFAALNLRVKWLQENVQGNSDITTLKITLGPIPMGEQPAACNAFWDGKTVNFFATGKIEDQQRGISAECNNTGEIADVVYHEWGHGLDQATHGGEIPDFAKSEAIGDIVAFHMTGDSVIGPGFFSKTPEGRDEDYVREVATDRVYPKDVPPPDPQTGQSEPHLESLIFSSTWWDLREALMGKLGAQAGHDQSAKLFFCHLPASTKYTASYESVIFCDDDNGNLADGTPNSDVIHAVFAKHGLAK